MRTKCVTSVSAVDLLHTSGWTQRSNSDISLLAIYVASELQNSIVIKHFQNSKANRILIKDNSRLTSLELMQSSSNCMQLQQAFSNWAFSNKIRGV